MFFFFSFSRRRWRRGTASCDAFDNFDLDGIPEILAMFMHAHFQFVLADVTRLIINEGRLHSGDSLFRVFSSELKIKDSLGIGD